MKIPSTALAGMRRAQQSLSAAASAVAEMTAPGVDRVPPDQPAGEAPVALLAEPSMASAAIARIMAQAAFQANAATARTEAAMIE